MARGLTSLPTMARGLTCTGGRDDNTPVARLKSCYYYYHHSPPHILNIIEWNSSSCRIQFNIPSVSYPVISSFLILMTKYFKKMGFVSFFFSFSHILFVIRTTPTIFKFIETFVKKKKKRKKNQQDPRNLFSSLIRMIDFCTSL